MEYAKPKIIQYFLQAFLISALLLSGRSAFGAQSAVLLLGASVPSSAQLKIEEGGRKLVLNGNVSISQIKVRKSVEKTKGGFHTFVEVIHN